MSPGTWTQEENGWQKSSRSYSKCSEHQLFSSVQFDTGPQTRQPSIRVHSHYWSMQSSHFACLMDVDVSISADGTEVTAELKSASYPCCLVSGSADDELILGVQAAHFLIMTWELHSAASSPAVHQDLAVTVQQQKGWKSSFPACLLFCISLTDSTQQKALSWFVTVFTRLIFRSDMLPSTTDQVRVCQSKVTHVPLVTWVDLRWVTVEFSRVLAQFVCLNVSGLRQKEKISIQLQPWQKSGGKRQKAQVQIRWWQFKIKYNVKLASLMRDET